MAQIIRSCPEALSASGIKKIACPVIALAGNPNVGKSTLFNALTGLRQHTGNWPGKTVTTAQGFCHYKDKLYQLIDLPGTYSLRAHSAEEEAARDYLCQEQPDAVIVVCDATCLERNLNLALQIMELTPHVLLCVNLMDEAKKKHIQIDLPALSTRLGIPVVGTVARGKRPDALMQALDGLLTTPPSPYCITYPTAIEQAIQLIQPYLPTTGVLPRWKALRLLEDPSTLAQDNSLTQPELNNAMEQAKQLLSDSGLSPTVLHDEISCTLVRSAEVLCDGIVCYERADYNVRDRKLDRLLTSRRTGLPIMLLLLMAIFWLTIVGANYPSEALSAGFSWLGARLSDAFRLLHAPTWLHGILIDGAYRTLAWVIAVMLPPMAIFFPLFTLLEDLGYLPRVAFNLDKYFKRCNACGKQALTMCMGFGCNAAGVVGCRIIDSPRERLIAILTNNFVPCNGRFPTLIALLTMFFVGGTAGLAGSALSAILLTGLILLGILTTLGVSWTLSRTILRGMPSSFTLELPSYRRPQIGKVLLRSLLDRTVFVLGRAAAIAAPAGLLLWALANITVSGQSLLQYCTNFLDPFARLLGMDGAILTAFILGFPANEIVIPILIMIYLQTGSLSDLGSLWQLKELLLQHGWTWVTAVSMLLFSLMHWPCSTTCLTIKKETRSLKWTLVSFLVPTVTGLVVCFLFASIARLFL